jgi:D-3-phosphoglycerate dehydrogenase / 2-oxoglutarate reductase
MPRIVRPTGAGSECGPVLVAYDHVLADTLAGIARTLQRSGYDVRRPRCHGRAPGPELSTDSLRDAAVVVASSRTHLPAALLESAPRLRGVVFPSIGIESCDLAAASRLGVVVANGATVENVHSMAEATVMLMAALRLELPVKRRQLVAYAGHAQPPPVTGRMLCGSTIGLVGFGRIAREVTRRLVGWQVGDILAHTRSAPVAGGPPMVRFVDLRTLLRESDVVSLHLPLTDQTRGMLGRAELETMRRGSILINTARGGLVDEVALAQALNDGRLAGAAIDTFATEPPPLSHPLLACKNTLLTRHNVGHTRELFASLVPTAVENVVRILGGRDPLHLCNPAVISQLDSSNSLESDARCKG